MRLFEWGDLENSERAASEAAGLNASLGIEDTSPLKLLSRVREAQQEKLKLARTRMPKKQSLQAMPLLCRVQTPIGCCLIRRLHLPALRYPLT